MTYNKIMIPLRCIAIGIAIILLLCSFEHPFDMHAQLDETVKQAQEQVELEQVYQIYLNEVKRSRQFEYNFDQGYVHPNPYGTIDRYEHSYGTYDRYD